MNKPEERKNKILFINAVDEIRREKTISYLDKEHRDKIEDAYKSNNDIDQFSKFVDLETIENNNYNLNIALYVTKVDKSEEKDIKEVVKEWNDSCNELRTSFDNFFKLAKEVGLIEK